MVLDHPSLRSKARRLFRKNRYSSCAEAGDVVGLRDVAPESSGLLTPPAGMLVVCTARHDVENGVARPLDVFGSSSWWSGSATTSSRSRRAIGKSVESEAWGGGSPEVERVDTGPYEGHAEGGSSATCIGKANGDALSGGQANPPKGPDPKSLEQRAIVRPSEPAVSSARIHAGAAGSSSTKVTRADRRGPFPRSSEFPRTRASGILMMVVRRGEPRSRPSAAPARLRGVGRGSGGRIGAVPTVRPACPGSPGCAVREPIGLVQTEDGEVGETRRSDLRPAC